MDKRLIRLTESDLRRVVKESAKRILKEYGMDIDDDSYFGGGLPDGDFYDDAPEDDRVSEEQITELGKMSEKIADIANNASGDTELLFQAVECIDKFTQEYKSRLV